jgi:uncharacterized protein (UPF0303 family)
MMTTEQIEDTSNPANKLEKTAEGTKSPARTSRRKEQEVVALSLPNEEKSGGLKLSTKGELLPGNRPIEAGHLNVVSTYSSVGGERPVVSSGMDIVGTLTISGNRPIAASHLHISETYAVMGNRPVASNEVDDPTTLMGFLD